MLKDLTSSDNFMKEYMTVKGDLVRSQSIDVNFHVLGSNCWPIQQNVKCNIPKQLNSCQEEFEKYYKSRNQGKCIKFCIQMCTCLMEAKINPKTTKLFDLSGTQAVVLLAFNSLPASAPTLSFEQLIEITGLDAPELKKQLISLSMLEHQVLQLSDDS